MRALSILVAVGGCAQHRVTQAPSAVAVAAVPAPTAWGEALAAAGPPCAEVDLAMGPISAVIPGTSTRPSIGCRLGGSPRDELHRLVDSDAALRDCLASLSTSGSAELELAVSPAGKVAAARLVDQLGDPPLACAPLVLRLAVHPLGCRWRTRVTLAVARAL